MKRLGIILIVIIGVLLRLVAIDKSTGMWNDEYVSYMISNTPFFNGFINAVKSQCHMPFYYLYLKAVMALFGQSDVVLRLSSVFAGVLAVIVMYFVGKEKNTRTGIYCMAFSAISSFLIYYSQEVRLYSLLFLFSALTLLFTLRLIKKPDVKNLILFAVFAFLILFTHTIGFVFLFFNLIYISYKLYNSNKEFILKMWGIIGILLLLISPQIFGILSRKSFSQWWGSFSPSALGFLITDYFSPVLTNFTGAPPNFFYNFKSGFIIFAMIPTLTSVFFLGYALKEKANRELFYITAATAAVLVIAALSGKMVFITKYSIEIYPVLIYLACSGADLIKNKVLRNTGISIFCILSLFFLIFSPLAANKIFRKEGHKLAVDLIKNANLKKGDIIILQYYDQSRFKKYYDFSNNKVISMNKGNFPQYISAEATYANVYNDKNILRPDFSSEENTYFENKLLSEVNLRENQNVLLVVLKSVSFYNEDTIRKIADNNAYYYQTPILFLVFSYLKNETYKVLSKNYTMSGFAQNGEWVAVKFTKLHK